MLMIRSPAPKFDYRFFTLNPRNLVSDLGPITGKLFDNFPIEEFRLMLTNVAEKILSRLHI